MRPPASVRVLSFALLAFAGGCDDAFKYLFYPPESVEYALIPDVDLLMAAKDSSYSLSRDSLAVVYNRGTWKIEVKYMPDFQLNNVEFPEESQDGESSSNPFTFANWIDPQTGITPNRFSVFKISIFNYSASKLNFDPERSFLVTDRGDLLSGYGREEKTSKNQSLEGYFKRRKGASGVEDEIFERRMGIIRTTVLYLGRPIYAGDNREGFVIYDPLPESVEKVKLVFREFILGYDENNEPSQFTDLTFYFERTALSKQAIVGLKPRADSAVATGSFREIEIHQLRYRPPEGEEVAVGTEEWNVQPNALPVFAEFLEDSLRIRATIKQVSGESSDLQSASVVFLLAGPTDPIFTENEISGIANAIKGGALLVLDNSAFATQYQYPQRAEQLLEVIGSKLGDIKITALSPDNPIYRSWKKLDKIPEGMDDRENMPNRRDYLTGLMWRNRVVAVMSTKGYSMMWGRRNEPNTEQFILGANFVTYAISK
ncbi:MAG: hypothetical protein A3C56_01465 [Ignavibacteria bacterium RIFCSPHIGHO2_02_FULL_56_12]|nr:MAG: hypothetical protein A3C56_01465 [Ignavibacteria bacterium RIFCSPHIGHO2_02_FULL_56_12]